MTSAALMVGLGLVVFVAVFAAGLKSSISGQLDELVRADLVVYGQGFQPLPARTEAVIEDVDGVDAAVPAALRADRGERREFEHHLRPRDRRRPSAAARRVRVRLARRRRRAPRRTSAPGTR